MKARERRDQAGMVGKRWKRYLPYAVGARAGVSRSALTKKVNAERAKITPILPPTLPAHAAFAPRVRLLWRVRRTSLAANRPARPGSDRRRWGGEGRRAPD